MKQKTHLMVSPDWVGTLDELEPERAVCSLKATVEMSADDRGLIHGGFVFGLADYACMCAVNDPNVVIGGSNVKFLRPVTVGQTMVSEAWVTNAEGKKRICEVKVSVEGEVVSEGALTCFVLPKHVLDM